MPVLRLGSLRRKSFSLVRRTKRRATSAWRVLYRLLFLSVNTVCTLYQTFQDSSGGLMEGEKESTVSEATPLRPCSSQISATERLCKVIQELVDTERSYVKDLSCLMEIYLKPLQRETFLTPDEMESLFGSLPEMLDFQKVFLQTLEEKVASSPDFRSLQTPVQFKKLLFSLGGSFLYYADHFKLYSGFCANHIKVQKVLERAKTDQAFKEFLEAKNPTKQHSSTLESYLIKPVQRVLKYPLLLRELVVLTDNDSEEHYHLTEALKAMEKVASHINEMQKIYEEYGSVFDQLVAKQSGRQREEVTEISMGDFLMHSSVMWLNPFPSLGRVRKEPKLTLFVFKKAVILVYKDNNKLKKKMNMPRSVLAHGDMEQVKFCWLIPRSAIQVKLGDAAGESTETNCIWELIHTKSEGRPEAIFQFCSSGPECKVSVIKAIRSILRENVRRNLLGMELPVERVCKEKLVPLRSALPSSARLGSSRASWMCRQPPAQTLEALRPADPDSDDISSNSGMHSSEGLPPERSSQSAITILHDFPTEHGTVEESHVSRDQNREFSQRFNEQNSLPSTLEAKFQQLHLTEKASLEPAPCVQPEGSEVDTPERQPCLRRAHFCPVKRRQGRNAGGSFRRRQGALQTMRQHSRSLDSQTESMLANVDFNTLLEREFSVQSLTSVTNEDCFYDNVVEEGRQ
ncbi:T-lymphoma invasion and metastasis-inducing protein 2 [Chanos chanos]|uniref:T-lymphoma invasion and metastasis-inducing protein 2 n=1 Tax=Chanos chanos TaxID=29144 RepID=A0A6J2WIS5_CHACN|nr:T-lymphoma invasion and metastasis-inducing protein 2-like [Chanos chanos]